MVVNEQSQNAELVPVETAPALSLDVALANTRAVAEAQPNNLFPDGGSGELFAAKLLGVPFMVTGTPVYRTQPARMVAVRDEAGNDTGKQKQIPAHEVVQFPIRAAYLDTHTLGPVRIATLSSVYACNQVRNMTEHELFPFVWTVAENTRPEFALPRGGGPLMLRRWTPELATADAADHAGQDSPLTADPIGPAHLASTILELPPLPPASVTKDKPTARVRETMESLRAKLDPNTGKPWEHPSIVDAG